MASGGVSGDFAKLLKFAKKVGNLAGQAAMTSVSSAMGDATIELVDEGFKEEREPSGKPWKEHAIPTGGPILNKSGKLRRSFRKRQVSSRGFVVSSEDINFKRHQGGTGIYGPRKKRIKPKKKSVLAFPVGGKAFFAASVAGSPKRLMLPGARVPRAWSLRLKRRAETRLLEIFNGR